MLAEMLQVLYIELVLARRAVMMCYSFLLNMSQVWRRERRKKIENAAIPFTGVFCVVPEVLLISMAWEASILFVSFNPGFYI